MRAARLLTCMHASIGCFVPTLALPSRRAALRAAQPNVTGISSAPYYYTGPATGANLFTNTSVSVDSRLSYSQLYSLLSTPAVTQEIASGLSGGGWGGGDVGGIRWQWRGMRAPARHLVVKVLLALPWRLLSPFLLCTHPAVCLQPMAA